LKDSPKFLSIMKALQTNPTVCEKRKKAAAEGGEEITAERIGGSSGSDDAKIDTRTWPLGIRQRSTKLRRSASLRTCPLS
jgi:hypothetical protein